ADPDAGDSVRYTLSGADADLFVVDGAVLRLKDGVSLDYEQAATRTVTVTATDAAGASSTRMLTVNVADVNEAPTVTPASTAVTIAENQTGASVTTFTGADPDAGDHLHYALAGADAALFEIADGAVKLRSGVAFDHETKASYTVDLVATDDHGLQSVRSIVVTVADAQGETLVGASGDDRLVGGVGDDTLEGGAGADQLIGGADVDTAVYSRSSAGVVVDLSAGTGHGGEAEGDALTGVENVRGSDHADTLTGDGAANRLEGGAGDDTLTGGAGADFMAGGDGDDVFYSEGAGGGQDTIQGGAGFDSVRFAGGGEIVLTGLSGVETLDFGDGAANSATIDAATLGRLAPESDLLIINRDADDAIDLVGAADTGAQIIRQGVA
ncbi:MAG TPA: hypothetical protein VIL72_14185, partial [Beijerinckiaceae bacterium]